MSLLTLLPDTSRRTADIAVQVVLERPELMKEFVEACLEQTYPLSMRASRVVHLVCKFDPGILRPYLGLILERMPELHDQSVMRNFLNLFEYYVEEMSEDELGQLLSICFARLEDFSQAIAVRVLSLKLLYLISKRVPEIKPEILAIIQFNQAEATAAFQAQARQIVRKLNKEIL